MEDKKVEVDAGDGTAHVTFNLPLHENNYNNHNTIPTQPQSQRYFTDELSTPSPNYCYPTERLGRLHNSNTTYTTPSPTIHEVVGGGGGPSSSLAEVTPAFLRRAAQELGVTKSINAAMHSRAGRGGGGRDNIHNDIISIVPPNSLLNNHTTATRGLEDRITDTSFYGADASALDGTFVSIRDLNDDDDVPSINYDNDNGHLLWDGGDMVNHGIIIGGGGVDHPNEKTSLLQQSGHKRKGGSVFGSQMEEVDRRERNKIRRTRNWNCFTDWVSNIQQTLLRVNNEDHLNRSGQRVFAKQRVFSLFLIGALCFHMTLSGLHDLFLRYIAYRNPISDGEEVEINWNGEGEYIPPYWLSFEGRVFNPLIGPGARTLTAFGALVPGLVLSNGQGWRVMTALFEESSFVQLILHIWALKTTIGGQMTGLEWRCGTLLVSCIYVISALIGSAWVIAVDSGHVITTSGMGISGLLVASFVERACYPETSKDDGDESNDPILHNSNGGSNNAVVSSSSNEQFLFQQPNAKKKKYRDPFLNIASPALLLVSDMCLSWWAAYSSLPGTAMSALTGLACALLLFVGHPPSPAGNYDGNGNNDLHFNEYLSPQPSAPRRYVRHGKDDDSASTDTSVDAGRFAFRTPLMRRSIMGDDDDDEDEPMGMRSALRKRNSNGLSEKSSAVKGRRMSSLEKRNNTSSASRIISRVIGVLLTLLLTLIPASLIATGDGPTSEVTRAAILGCKPMRILYKADYNADYNSDILECAGGCIPLSRVRVARKNEDMRPGRCDSAGYQCLQQSGTMTLRGYVADLGIYVLPSSNGSCGDTNEVDGEGHTDDTNADANGDAQ